MATEGIEAIYLTTHNWGKAARFFLALGFKLEFATDHNSGQFRGGDGPCIFIAEVPPDQEPGSQVVLKVPDEAEFRPDPVVEVVTPRHAGFNTAAHISAAMLNDRYFAARTDDLRTSPGEELLVSTM
jgi:hypothetical protein